MMHPSSLRVNRFWLAGHFSHPRGDFAVSSHKVSMNYTGQQVSGEVILNTAKLQKTRGRPGPQLETFAGSNYLSPSRLYDRSHISNNIQMTFKCDTGNVLRIPSRGPLAAALRTLL